MHTSLNALDLAVDRVRAEDRLALKSLDQFSDDGCPHPPNASSLATGGVDHVWAGGPIYLRELDTFLLQVRHTRTAWNPGRIAEFGARLNDDECRSTGFIRGLAENVNVRPLAENCIVIRHYVERRIRVPVERCVVATILDSFPRDLRMGNEEAIGLSMISADQLDEVELITPLSREDMKIFRDIYLCRMAA